MAVAGCTLALAAPASAKTLDFQGPIGPSGAISFTVKGKGDKLSVRDLEWFRLPVECGNEENTTSGTLSYRVKVEKGKFEAKAVLGTKKKPKAKAVIKGKINGDKASGSINVSGTKLPVSDGTGNCASGKHPWNAAG